jgi:hypothetical protein
MVALVSWMKNTGEADQLAMDRREPFNLQFPDGEGDRNQS